MENVELQILNLIDAINEAITTLKPGNPPLITDLFYQPSDATTTEYTSRKNQHGSIHGNGSPNKDS